MSALAALMTVLERSAAERIVLCPGERPHAMTADGRRDVGTTVLSPAVVSALADEILSAEGRQALTRGVAVIEEIRELPTGHIVVAQARQHDDEIRLELLRQTRTPACADSALVHGYVERARAAGATALYLRAGSVPVMRVNGRIRPCGNASLRPPAFVSWQQVVRESWTRFDDGGDRWIRRDDTGTVHCRMFDDAHGPCATLTFAGAAAQFSRPVRLLRAIHDVCEARHGLLIVSAPTHAEMAAITSAAASFSGTQRGGYVVTIEPTHAPLGDMSAPLVSRRVLPVSDVASAIDAAVTELPDVLVVIEPRSAEHIAALMRAAAGERLVIVGLVARDAVEALTQIGANGGLSGVTPGQVARIFQAAFGVRCLRQLGGGYVNAYDVLKTTPEVVHALEHGDVALLRAAHRAGVTRGRNGDTELARAVMQRRLSLRTAVGHASDPAYVVGLVRQKRHKVFSVAATRAIDTRTPEGWTNPLESQTAHG